MNAKLLATIMFALLPNLALAQSSDQTKSKTNQSGNERGSSAPGKNGNGSDANGAVDARRRRNPMQTRPPRRRRSPLAMNKDGERSMNTSKQHRLLSRSRSETCENERAAAIAVK